MKILITSGGTIVPIDKVRRITNMSSGTFGSKIATEALKLGNRVEFLAAAGSKTPLSFKADLKNMTMSEVLNRLAEIERLKVSNPAYDEHFYKTYDDYASKLHELVTAKIRPQIIILAAAVSDYGVTNPVEGKIRTAGDMSIELSPLPKLISKIKEWHPECTLVGFKLLVNSTYDELSFAAHKSMGDNGCDLVVANDLWDIQNGDHRVMLVHENGFRTYYANFKPDNPNYLTQIVINAAINEHTRRMG
jgi:phosphopantothenate--cysteine ligase